MSRITIAWGVFISILNPMMFRMPSDPIYVTAMQVALCLIMLAWADRIERRI